MKLYATRIPIITQDMLQTLQADGDIELANDAEAKLDIEAILREYLRLERELIEKAKDMMEQRNLSYDQFSRIKRTMAEERGIANNPEEAIGFLTNQILESFMQSPNIEEVFTDDVLLRKKVQGILRKHMQIEEQLDAEVRRKMKNLNEGTTEWDVEYRRVMEQEKRKFNI